MPPNNWQGYHQGKNRDTTDMDVIAELRNPMTIGAGNVYDVLLITERHDLIDTIFFEYTASLLTHILNDEVTGFTGTDLEKIDQLFNDNVQLNVEGIFYMAAVSYASIYGVSPVGVSIPAEINTTTGEELLQVAWENVDSYRQNYQVKTMPQCRAVMANQVCASCYNLQGRPGQVNSCIQRMNNTSTFLYNPFNWPAPD